MNSNKLWLLLSGVLAILGVYAIGTVLVQGHAVLNSTNDVPWNIFVSNYVFFVVTSTGVCFVSAFGHVFGMERYKLISQKAVYLSLILLIVGGMSILIDIGSPWLVFAMLISPNFTSPMFWMFVLYSLYGLFLICELVYLRQGNHKKTKQASCLAALTALIAHSVLGALFGMVQAKPLWFGPYLPIYFILSALISGLAVLIAITVIAYRSSGKTMPSEIDGLMRDMAKILFYTLCAGLFCVFWKTAAGIYSGKEDAALLTHGPFSFSFWGVEICVGLALPAVMLASASARSPKQALWASLLVLVGLFPARFNLVIAGQLVRPWDGMGLAQYSVNAIEIMLTLGLFGFFGILYFLGIKYLGLENYLVPASQESSSPGIGVSG